MVDSLVVEKNAFNEIDDMDTIIFEYFIYLKFIFFLKEFETIKKIVGNKNQEEYLNEIILFSYKIQILISYR